MAVSSICGCGHSGGGGTWVPGRVVQAREKLGQGLSILATAQSIKFNLTSGSTLEELNLFVGLLLEGDNPTIEATSIEIKLKMDHLSSLSRNIPKFFVSLNLTVLKIAHTGGVIPAGDCPEGD